MLNLVIIGALIQEGTSQASPPYFNRQHFSQWKVCMEIYAKSYDVKIWRVIKKWDYPIPAAKSDKKMDRQVSTDPVDRYTWLFWWRNDGDIGKFKGKKSYV